MLKHVRALCRRKIWKLLRNTFEISYEQGVYQRSLTLSHLSSSLAEEILYDVCVLKLFYPPQKCPIPFCPPPQPKDQGVRSGALAMPSG